LSKSALDGRGAEQAVNKDAVIATRGSRNLPCIFLIP
jgi:hypothetical protein